MEIIKEGNVVSLSAYKDNIKMEDLRMWRLEQLGTLEQVDHPLHCSVVAGTLVNHFELLKQIHDGDAESDFMVDIYGTPVALRIRTDKLEELVYEFMCFQRKTAAKDSPTFMTWKITPADASKKEAWLSNDEYPVVDGYIPRLRDFGMALMNQACNPEIYVSPLLMLIPAMAASLPHAPHGIPPFKVTQAMIVDRKGIIMASSGELDMEVIFDAVPCETSI